jgi:hypothetical protein
MGQGRSKSPTWYGRCYGNRTTQADPTTLSRASFDSVQQVNRHCSPDGQESNQMAKRARTIAIVTALVQGAAETPAEFLVRQANTQVADEGLPPDPATLDMIEPALKSTIKMVCPYKALEKQKRFMRHKMRKPADMKIRIFVNHLHRINFDEIPQLPPFVTGQELSNNELLDIILFGIPKSWVKEMDKQDFDPHEREDDIQVVIQFCEHMESAEDSNHTQKSGSTSKNSNKKTRFSNNKGKPSKGNGKWCEYHETNTHNMSECLVLKKMKESGRNNSSDKKPFNKNKTWTKKSNNAKKFSKKELNALVKKASKKAVKKVTKELSTVSKCKRDDDNNSTSSLHMLKNEMKDVDDQLKNINFEAVNKVEV